MKINSTRIHNSNVLLATCDDARILESERDELIKAETNTNWIEAPTKQETITLNRLIERYNTKITDLLWQ